MGSKENDRQFSNNADEEKQDPTLLQDLEATSASILKWVRVIFVTLIVIWLTILTSPILIPNLAALVLR